MFTFLNQKQQKPRVFLRLGLFLLVKSFEWAVEPLISSAWGPSQGEMGSYELLVAGIGPSHTCIGPYDTRSRVFYYWGLGIYRLDGSYRR